MTLLLLLAAPIIIPWLIQLAPRLRAFFVWTRGARIEEVEIAGFHLKLASLADGVAEAAEKYEAKVLQTSANAGATIQNPETITAAYTQMLEHIETSTQIPSVDAIQRIDQLADMYDDARTKLASGPVRKQLLSQISGVMWSLMASVDEFDAAKRISGDSGGRRLSGYKYIEVNARTDQLDLLLSRAMGILETPFGQYAALLALRRVVTAGTLAKQDRERILDSLNWSLGLSYIAYSDQASLIRSLLELLNSRLVPMTGNSQH